MKMLSNFSNLLAKELDTKYFPEVKYYRNNKNTQEIHYTCELFNNGCLTYDKLIQRLSKASGDTLTNIHQVVSKYVEDFDGYEYEPFIIRKKFLYEGIELRIAERDESYMGKEDITMRMTRVLAPNGGSVPLSIGHKWTLKKIQEEAIKAIEVFKSMGADVKDELTKAIVIK